MDDAIVAEKMALYDRLCEEAGKYSHLCGFKDGKCLRGDPVCCILQPGTRRAACDNLDPKNGCRVVSLPCKIWFCGFVRQLHPELDPLIEEWGKAAKALAGMLFFQSRTDYESSLRRD